MAALRGVSWTFGEGSFTAVMGPSGSGKSTLLTCAAGLVRPSEGTVFLGGTAIHALPENELAVVRRERVGFVFQEFNLIPALTARENIELPLRLAGRPVDTARLDRIARRAGIHDRLSHRPDQLSGGQQQRVALCRALITAPDLVCADEPTGALDSGSSRQVMDLLREAVDDFGQTLVLVTHDPLAASYADRVLFLVDGSIAGTMDAPTSRNVAERMAVLAGAS
ncbi:ABC transporter ATP-binding protein [Nocardiopsis coralli]|uniref:ABC transporter ATP-binding protein n=1 Tax=Nocardiopsis coralli TaxID=2772213 RepID=UPI002E2CB81C|nr:ABC transporter ATP-binding protein [Nocardiopsis coralli]